MFKVYISDYKGAPDGSERLVQTVPAGSENMLKLIAPVVKCDMGNAESFEFSIEGGTQYCDSFLQMKTFMRVEYDGTTIFMGRVLTVDNGFRGTRKIRCEGPLAFFNDSPVRGAKEEDRRSISVNAHMSELISNHNSFIHDSRRSFTLGEVPGQYSSASGDQQLPNTERKYGQDGWTDTKSALEDLRSHYGGYFRARPGRIGDTITLDWMNHYFNSSVIDQTVEVGKNILDISNVNEVDNIFTAIIPIGSNKETSSSNTEAHFCLDQVSVTVPEICSHFSAAELNRGYHQASDYASAIERYGYIYKTVNFDDATTKEKLYNDACEWILNNYQGEVPKFTVKAIDMHQIGSDGNSIDKIMVGDRVHIIYPVVDENGVVHKRDTYQTCISAQYDLYNPENNSYTFGIPANIMTKSYGLKKQTKKSANATASEQKNTPSEGAYSGGTKQTWKQKMKDWLNSHKVHYTGEKPFVEDATHRQFMEGPHAEDTPSSVESRYHYFYTGVGALYLWKATNVGTWKGTEEEYNYYYEHILTEGGYLAAENFKKANTLRKWKLSLEPVGGVTDSLIYTFNLPDYIKDEYGIDLTNGTVFNGTTIPSEIELDDGGVVYTTVDGETKAVTVDVIEQNGSHFTMDMTGCSYTVIKDVEGNIHYYVKNSTGQWEETTNPRKLELEVADSANFKGWLIRDGYADVTGPNAGQRYAYKFGIGIENNELGDGRQLAVARVDGDVVRIGSSRSEQTTVIAHQFSGNWVTPYNVIKDSTGKVIGMTYLDQAGTKSYKGRYDPNTGEFIEDPNGDISFTASGIWDGTDLRFKGGIVTGTTDTGEVVSYVKSNRLVIGNYATDLKVKDALYNSGLISDDKYGQAVANALVTESVYAKKINAIDADFKDIYTNYLKTSWITSSLGNIDLLNVKSIATSKTDNTGSCSFDNFYGDHYYVYVPGGGGSVSYVDLRYCFDKVEKTMNGNTVTLTFHRADGSISQDNPRTDQVSFDIATSLLGNWSGSASLPVLTVQDQAPVPHTYKIGFGENTKVDRRLDVTGNGTPTAYKNDKQEVVEKYLNVPIKVFEISPPSGVGSGGGPPTLTTRYSKTMTGVDGTVVYDQGWAKCYASKSVTTTGKSGSLGYGSQGSAKVTIKAGPNDKTATTLLDISWVAPGDNSASGYSSCWQSYRSAATRDSGILDPGQSAGVAIYMKDSSGVERLRDNWYWTAKSVSIDIPSSQISTISYWPSGDFTELTKLRNACKSAKDNGDNVIFRVDAGGKQKWYIMDFS